MSIIDEAASMIVDLISGGMTQEEIGRAIGRSQEWVSYTSRKTYKDLRASDFQALGELHARVKAEKGK